MPQDEMIDRAAVDTLLTNVGGDVEFLSELMEEFFLDANEQFAKMRMALDSGDNDSFRLAAHSLKSNAASFGAVQLTALCKELEAMGKAGNLSDAAGVLDDTDALFRRVKPALQAILNEDKK